MFKNILRPLNKNKEQVAAAAATTNIVEKDDKLFEPNNKLDKNNNNNDDIDANSAIKQKQHNHRLIGRKGRKRISAMMGRLNNRLKGHNKDTAAGDDDENNYADDSDDEYISAEEILYRKSSLSQDDQEPINENVDEIIKSRELRSGHHQLLLDNNKKQQPADTKESPTSDSKDVLLPEEDCDIPSFFYTKNCDHHLIEETRRLLKERYVKNPDSFYDLDYKRMMSDDWTVSRFLLRRRLDPKRTAKLMEECGRFRKTYKMSEVKLWEFPMEFHKAGGLFKYAPDRVGNLTLYMRVKMYRRVPEISDVFKAFILCVLELCDEENNGRGTAIIFDLSGCGLQNVDLGFLSWLLSSFRNYCPKGVSYILVYNLPWILNATCKLAMTWMSASNRRALRFAYGQEIEKFIAKENLPDYCGGSCAINYRKIPQGSRPALEVCEQLDITREQALKIRELFKEYLKDDAGQDYIPERHESDNKSHYDDAKSLSNSDFDCSTTLNVPISQQQSTNSGLTNTTAHTRTPVADLVSQASKFVAH